MIDNKKINIDAALYVLNKKAKECRDAKNNTWDGIEDLSVLSDFLPEELEFDGSRFYVELPPYSLEIRAYEREDFLAHKHDLDYDYDNSWLDFFGSEEGKDKCYYEVKRLESEYAALLEDLRLGCSHNIIKLFKGYEIDLYALKNEVLKKLQKEGKAEFVGVHRMAGQEVRACYKVGEFLFHGEEIEDSEEYEDCEELDIISADCKIDLQFKEAKNILENYIKI